MKLSLVLSLLGLFIFTSVAHADQKLVTCTRVQNSTGFRYFILEITDKNVTHFKARLFNNRMRTLAATKLPNQNVPDYTSYSVQGITSTMEVANQVLEDQGGLARMGEYDFSCM